MKKELVHDVVARETTIAYIDHRFQVLDLRVARVADGEELGLTRILNLTDHFRRLKVLE